MYGQCVYNQCSSTHITMNYVFLSDAELSVSDYAELQIIIITNVYVIVNSPQAGQYGV